MSIRNIVVLLLAATIAKAFRVPSVARRTAHSNTLISMAEGEGSPLPAFNEIVSQPVSKIESPIVDRALDSALDFLQKGEDDLEDEEEDEFEMFDIFDESPDFEIPYDLIAELEEKETSRLASKGPTGADLNSATITAAIQKWKRHDNDVGSSEVQIAIANERIKYLTKHLLANKHDVSARRGLQALVNTRRKFLNYLFTTDQPKAELMVKELGIRFRPPGRLWDKEAKYGAYKNTKSKWQKIRAAAKQGRVARAAVSQ